MNRPFEGRVALVTGAAGDGIGKAVARRLAEGGASVVVTDIHERRAKETTESLRLEFGDRVLGFAYDVADRERAVSILDEVAEQLGPVDVLVNNAAENVLAPISTYATSDWERGIDVNLTGCFHLIQCVLPHMMEQGWGSIVNITSVAAWLAGGGREGPYAASKAALHSLTRSVAFEAGPSGVRCNAVAPGIIHSKFVEKYRKDFDREITATPLRRIGDAEEVANVVSFLVSDESSFVTGEVINVSGGWYMRG